MENQFTSVHCLILLGGISIDHNTQVSLHKEKDVLKFDYSKAFSIDDDFSIYHAETVGYCILL